MDWSVVTADPFPYHKDGVEFALRRPYCLIGDEQGLGKTFQAIAVALHTRSRTLVVAPAFLRLNWAREFYKFSALPIHLTVLKKLKDPLTYDTHNTLDDIVVISYEQVKYAADLFAWAELVIVDEVQYLKSDTAQRSIFFDRYLYENTVPRMIALSGTPMENRVEELYNLLTMLSYGGGVDDAFNVAKRFRSKSHFCETFSYKRLTRVRGHTVVKWDGLRNGAELSKILNYYMIRRKSDDVLSLVPYLEKTVVVAYDDDEALLEEWTGFNEASAIETKAKAKSAALKSKFTAEYCAPIMEGGESVVVFSDHVLAAKQVAEALGIPFIDGSVTAKKRDELVADLQSGKIAGLSCTIGAASVGFNMTKATHLVFNDLSWVPARNGQALKRIHRIGQTKKCLIHYIIGSKQDEYISENLRRKLKVISEVVDGHGSKV